MQYTTSCNTQSSASDDGRNYRPKHVELIGIINKPLLLHLVVCLYYCISDARSYKYETTICIYSRTSTCFGLTQTIIRILTIIFKVSKMSVI